MGIIVEVRSAFSPIWIASYQICSLAWFNQNPIVLLHSICLSVHFPIPPDRGRTILLPHSATKNSSRKTIHFVLLLEVNRWLFFFISLFVLLNMIARRIAFSKYTSNVLRRTRVPKWSVGRCVATRSDLKYTLIDNKADKTVLLLHGIMGNRRNWGNFVKL